MRTWKSPLRVLFCRQNEVRSSQCCKTLNYSEQSPRKATFSRAGQKFPAYYGPRRFITVFTTVRHVFLSCAKWTLSATSDLVSQRSILILSSRFRLFTMLHCFRDGLSAVILMPEYVAVPAMNYHRRYVVTQCCPTVSIIPVQRPCSGWHLLSASLP
jgi:hypothetical protein